jgi:methionyl-tRNA synthetase
MKKQECYFLTGTDEHGDKIVRAAKKENLSPREYVEKISSLFKNLWPELNISNSYFVRTTDQSHILTVENVLRKIYASGDIYFAEYEGQYCFGCERFYSERELVEGKCPDHGTVPEVIKESNYFFKMSKYQQWLLDHIEENPDFIRPERYKNEVLSFLREPLEDLCISRPKSRLKWGITLPFDEDYVTYVWFDALLNYVSALGYPDGEMYEKFWPYAQHIVAKDILKPHGIYWPTILKSAGIPLFKHLNVHGFWNVDHSKMSKSIGNVVEPLQMKNVYGTDAFRFFLIRDMVFGLDSDYSEETMVQRINSDLANDLGNLFSRVIAMVHKYFKAVVPRVDSSLEKEMELGLKEDAFNAVSCFEASMENFSFHKAMIAVWEFINKMNKYVDVTAPWILAKQKSTRKQLEAVIFNLLEGLRIVSGLIYPVMPDTAKTMQKHLGLDPDIPFYTLDLLRSWNTIKPETKLPKGITLFPRIDIEKVQKERAEVASTITTDKEKIPEITLEELSRVDLRVATVIKAEIIPRAKKLLKLEVDMGEVRTIVAGIANDYGPEDLVGKQVIVVANLKPAKLMGILSNGMVLAAVEDGKSSIATLDREVKPGTSLR